MTKESSNVISLRAQQLVCSSCGAGTDAACSCGVAYVPSGAKAAAAVAANPEKSSRFIAEQLGVGRKTVDRARQAAVEAGGPHGPPEKRVGRDGKSYPAPAPAPARRYAPAESMRESIEGPVAWLNRATSAADMATYAPFETVPRTRKMLKAIGHVIASWTALKQSLEEEMKNGKT